MAHRIQFRRDTAARWAEFNPILMEGEVAYETDGDQYKMGDGIHPWSELEYRGFSCVQQTGSSTTTPMSQAAVTELFNSLNDGVTKLNDDVRDRLRRVATVRMTGILTGTNSYTTLTLDQGSVYVYYDRANKRFGALAAKTSSAGGNVLYPEWVETDSVFGNEYYVDEENNNRPLRDKVYLCTEDDAAYQWSDAALDLVRVDASVIDDLKKETEAREELAESVEQNAEDISDLQTATNVNTSNIQANTDAITNLGLLVQELSASVFPLEVSFSLNNSVLEFTGKSQNIGATFSVTRQGVAIVPDSITVLKNGATYTTLTPASSGTLAFTLDASDSGAVTFSLVVKYDILSTTATATVNVVLPMYFGFSQADNVNDLDITSLTKMTLKTSAAGTYTLTAKENGWLWMCVPSTMTITKVTLNGFDVPMEDAVTGSTDLGSYKCYRGSNELLAEEYEFVVS